MIDEEQVRQLPGREMLDRGGERIGEIGQVFVDDRTGEPTWVTVKTGWFGTSQSFVPLHRVQVSGDRVLAGYDTATVKDAPRFATDRPLTPQDEDRLSAHYGLEDASRGPRRGPAGRDVMDSPGGLEAGAGPAVAAGAADIGRARVCALCGAYIAPDMLNRHETFHNGVAQPPGNYARHDVAVTEPADFTVAPT